MRLAKLKEKDETAEEKNRKFWIEMEIELLTANVVCRLKIKRTAIDEESRA